MRSGLCWGIAMTMVIFCTPTMAYDWSTNPGDGSAENPYQISEPNHLIAIGADPTLLNKHFILTNDIIFDPNNNPDHVFSQSIIGKYIGEPFTGSFDGGGYRIQDLSFNGGNYVGLFGAIEHPAVDPNCTYSVKNLVLVNPTIRLLNGGHQVGCLVGYNISTIINCTVQDALIEASSSTENVGCVAGINIGTLIHCNAINCSITGQWWLMGGLVGRNSGTLRYCTATGDIEGNSYIGLLAGQNYDGTIDTCETNGTVIGTGYSYYVGGLVGRNVLGNISNCSSAGPVSGASHIGGIAGDNLEGPMQRCSTSCSVTGVTIEPTTSFNIGGFIGHNDFRSSSTIAIERCFATGNVSGYRACGGFIGRNMFGNVFNCYANGNTVGYREVGGLFGDNFGGMIQHCYASGIVEGEFNAEGLIGENMYIQGETIINCYFLLNNDHPYYSGIGISESQMKMQASFIDWDFLGESANGDNEIWRMCVDGVDYPKLSWEFARNGDFACGDGVDLADLQALAGHWLLVGTAHPAEFNYAVDANGDGRIDLADFEVLAENWP